VPNNFKEVKMPAQKNKFISIIAYITAQKPVYSAICKLLRTEINAVLPKARSKLYHSIPVWFIGANAVVGFYVTANKGVNLLFWNGQAFKEPELEATGSFKAAQIKYRDVSEINRKHLRHWLKKSGKDIWDFAGLRKKYIEKTKKTTSN